MPVPRFIVLSLIVFTLATVNSPIFAADTLDVYKKATLCFGGDLLLGGYYNSPKYGTANELVDRIDELYSINGAKSVSDSLFRNIKFLFDQADLGIANLEGPVTPRMPFDHLKENLIDKMFPVRQHEKTPDILVAAGINLVSLANNHMFDYNKEEGLALTIQALGGKVDYVGAGYGTSAYEPLVKEVNDVRIAFLGLSDLLDPEEMYADNADLGVTGIPEAHKDLFMGMMAVNLLEVVDDVDFTVVIAHAGPISGTEITPAQAKVFDYFLDLGVDLIVGSHSHYKQAIKEIPKDEPGQFKQLAFYGLGNLVFGGRRGAQALSTIASVQLYVNHQHGDKYMTYFTTDIMPNPDTTFTPVIVGKTK